MLKTLATVAINTMIAVFGTAVLESPLARIFHPKTGFGVISREWILSLIFAGALGFFIPRSWTNRGARWSWIIPLAWFSLGFLAHMALGRMVGRLSGYDCAVQLGRPGCRDFFLFTLPLARGLAYSATAALEGNAHSPPS
jgi:hypothetical protein